MKYIKGKYYFAFHEEIWKCTAINKNGECFHLVYPNWDRDYPIKDKNYGYLSLGPLSLNALIDSYQPKPHTPLIAKFVRGALKQLVNDLRA